MMVTILPTVLLTVLKRARERVWPSIMPFSLLPSLKKVPKRKASGSILAKSGVVPRIGTEEKVFFSEATVLIAVAIGATAATSLILAIASVSDIERLDCWKVLEEVSSSIILVKESLVEVGRTTMRSEPISLT